MRGEAEGTEPILSLHSFSLTSEGGVETVRNDRVQISTMYRLCISSSSTIAKPDFYVRMRKGVVE